MNLNPYILQQHRSKSQISMDQLNTMISVHSKFIMSACLLKKEDGINGNDLSKTDMPNSYDAAKYWEVNELPEELDFITISRHKDKCVSVSSTSFQFTDVPFGEYQFYFYLRNSYGVSQPKPIPITINKNLTTVNFTQARTTQDNSDFTETKSVISIELKSIN